MNRPQIRLARYLGIPPKETIAGGRSSQREGPNDPPKEQPTALQYEWYEWGAYFIDGGRVRRMMVAGCITKEATLGAHRREW